MCETGDHCDIWLLANVSPSTDIALHLSTYPSKPHLSFFTPFLLVIYYPCLSNYTHLWLFLFFSSYSSAFLQPSLKGWLTKSETMAGQVWRILKWLSGCFVTCSRKYSSDSLMAKLAWWQLCQHASNSCHFLYSNTGELMTSCDILYSNTRELMTSCEIFYSNPWDLMTSWDIFYFTQENWWLNVTFSIPTHKNWWHHVAFSTPTQEN